MIPRYIEPFLSENLHLEKRKLLLLLGPRQTGKTTLVKRIAGQFEGKNLYLTGDDPTVRSRFSDAGLEALRPILQGYDLFPKFPTMNWPTCLESTSRPLHTTSPHWNKPMSYSVLARSAETCGRKLPRPGRYIFMIPASAMPSSAIFQR